jgi:MoxR-like ATPase
MQDVARGSKIPEGEHRLMPDFDRYGWYEGRSEAQLDKERYLASSKLATAVNTALAAEMPLLVTGEPGTGKSMLAQSIADQLGLKLYRFHTRSDHHARDLLYTFDNLRRFYDAQAHGVGLKPASEYVELRALGLAIKNGQEGRESVVLVDEIDKAPRDFPNDLLDVLDRMRFRIDETNHDFESPNVRPIVLITSNSERQLPDAFLRRCVFHHIEFPDTELLQRILAAHLKKDELPAKLAETAIGRFLELRSLPGLEKRPATNELITWVRVLLRAGVPDDLPVRRLSELPHLGALLKTQIDLESVKS